METTTAHLNKTELNDRTLWYDGDSTIEESEITRLLSLGLPVEGLFVEQLSADIEQYNTLVPTEQQISIKQSVDELKFNWNIPEPYKSLNVVEYVIDQWADYCAAHEELTSDECDVRAKRVSDELTIYRSMELDDVLRALIYIINTLRTNKIVWGVGRGSSVSSYILYLIGVHDVDSVEYGLDITDFLRLE